MEHNNIRATTLNMSFALMPVKPLCLFLNKGQKVLPSLRNFNSEKLEEFEFKTRRN